jgi:hypothetical protein
VDIPDIGFDEFMSSWSGKYKQDQHVTVIGPTGCGKTTLVTELIRPRGHVVALGVKHVDKTMEKLIRKERWHKVERWNQRPKSAQRVVLWPKANDLNKVMDTHNKVFSELFRSVFKIGHWTIWMDELTYLADHVGLKKPIKQMYILARSNKISLVGSAQRPAWIPLEAYSQASHLILFRTGDERDLARIGSLNGTDAKQVAATVSRLPYHSFLHVDLTNGDQVISKVA